ncbi:MAG: hypothetical protein HYX26_10725 [Acidobacteriales bacterium]|nr:hypothetical protein [Terriglobales bacterium]
MSQPWWKSLWRATLLSVGISDPYPELRPKRDNFTGEWVRFDQRPRGPRLLPQRLSVRHTPEELSYVVQTPEGTVERRYSFSTNPGDGPERAHWDRFLLTLQSEDEPQTQQWSLSDDAKELTVIERSSAGKVVHSYRKAAE